MDIDQEMKNLINQILNEDFCISIWFIFYQNHILLYEEYREKKPHLFI
jgi:hypothetical protein